MYLNRLIEPTIKKTCATFPVTVICGPRQSGKTTLLRNMFLNQEVTFISLDDPNYRRLLMEDPVNYFNDLPKPIILDEVQYLPEITTYVKILIDRDRTPGQWYITGSQQFCKPPSFRGLVDARFLEVQGKSYVISEKIFL